MPDEAARPSEDDKGTRKRSQRVTLMLMAGCGALAYSFARLDPSQREEEVRVYRDLPACLDGHLRSETDCRAAYGTALALYPRAAPRYQYFPDCESAHGHGTCLIGERVVADAEKQFIPTMAAFVVGVTREQALPPQPAFGSACVGRNGYDSRDEVRYITASGAWLTSPPVGDTVVAHARSVDLRAEPDTLRKAVFGGFGSAGRTCIEHASGGG